MDHLLTSAACMLFCVLVHPALLSAMAAAYPPRPLHEVEPLMRISGLEPLNYQPDAANMRSTFLNIGERCNVAGSIMFKKAIINNDYDTALSIALKQVQQGAHVLDINMDDGLIDGVAAMTKFVNLCIAGARLGPTCHHYVSCSCADTHIVDGVPHLLLAL
jgi:hypothetical protein